jgi:phage gp36-like protein
MSYFTRGELVSAIDDVNLTKALDDNADGSADSNVFESLLNEVDLFINGYLEQAGISLPLASVPGRLKHLALRYAEYRLCARRNYHDRATDIYNQWIKPGMEWLEKIATGRQTLIDDDADADAAAAAITEDAKSYNATGAMIV